MSFMVTSVAPSHRREAPFLVHALARNTGAGSGCRTWIRPEGAGLGGPSGRIYELVVPLAGDQVHAFAKVLKVPWSEYHPFTPRLGFWW